MKHYSSIKFNEFLKKDFIFSQDDAWVWYQGTSKYVSQMSNLLDIALKYQYLKLIPNDPSHLPIRIGDKVVDQDNFYFIVTAINTATDRVYDSAGGWLYCKVLRHCTPEEITKYFC